MLKHLFTTSVENGWNPYWEQKLYAAIEVDSNIPRLSQGRRAAAQKLITTVAPLMDGVHHKNLMFNSFVEFVFSGVGLPPVFAVKAAKQQQHCLKDIQNAPEILSLLWHSRWDCDPEIWQAAQEEKLFEYHNWLLECGAPVTNKFLAQMKKEMALFGENWCVKKNKNRALDVLECTKIYKQKKTILATLDTTEKTLCVQKVKRKI